jgi:S-(hydroxymethyl)glutathione dehydrogenase/alcohol dehydrogenase
VEAVGEGVTRIKVGDHVVLNWSPSCGHCFFCLHDKPNLCETYLKPVWAGVMLDGTPRLAWNGQPVYHFCGLGTFAEYVTVPQESCVAVRQDVPFAIAALVGCAVSTGVGAALYTSPVRPGDNVAVFGCGGVGLSIIMGAALAGASMIIAVDTNPNKLEMVRDFGATHSVLTEDDAVREIRALTDGRGAEHVFEAVGIPSVQEQAFRAVRSGGTLALVGLSAMGTGTNLPGAVITRRETTIKGSYYGSINAARDFPLLLDLYASGKLPLDKLISREYKLSQINEAYEAMLTGEMARGVIVF